jgi:very-short-patch-repair endonuclease
MKRNVNTCEKCNREISLSNFSKHVLSCKGLRIKKIRGVDYDPNSRFKDPNFVSSFAWNKGLTKESSSKVAQIVNTFKSKIASGEIIVKGKPHDDNSKSKISVAMKKAHAEGRAWNIGMSRWNNKPSYPEEWFISVIDNEFSDKEYKREFAFSKYSIDFAWPHLRKAIEIDGEQHLRFPEYAKRDSIKDALLRESGWSVLRLPWKTIFNNTKDSIKQMKNFIES